MGGTLEQLILSNITMLFDAEEAFTADAGSPRASLGIPRPSAALHPGAPPRTTRLRRGDRLSLSAFAARHASEFLESAADPLVASTSAAAPYPVTTLELSDRSAGGPPDVEVVGLEIPTPALGWSSLAQSSGPARRPGSPSACGSRCAAGTASGAAARAQTRCSAVPRGGCFWPPR